MRESSPSHPPWPPHQPVPPLQPCPRSSQDLDCEDAEQRSFETPLRGCSPPGQGREASLEAPPVVVVVVDVVVVEKRAVYSLWRDTLAVCLRARFPTRRSARELKLAESRLLSRVLQVLVVVYVGAEAARDGSASHHARRWLALTNHVILLAFCGEQLARYLALPADLKLWRASEKADAVLVATAAVSQYALAPLSQGVRHVDPRYVAGACVSLRLLTLTPETRQLVAAIAKIWRLLWLFAVVFGACIYVYAALAVDLCADVLPGRHHWAYDAGDSGDDQGDDHPFHRRYARACFVLCCGGGRP